MRQNQKNNESGPILVLGDTGNTGRRVASRLEARGVKFRRGSRSSSPPFDWLDSETWPAVLAGVESVYLAYPQALPLDGATAHIRDFVAHAQRAGVSRIVLLTGRGEEEGLRQEEIVRDSGLASTVIRSAWFNQNFTEGGLAEMVHSGELIFPGDCAPEPFVDLEDLADVVVAALTLPGHTGQIYEVTGPQLLNFFEVAEVLSQARNRSVAYVPVTHSEFLGGLTDAGFPDEDVSLMDFLFGELLDGRNAKLGDGVQRALGREPKDFAAFAQREFAGESYGIQAQGGGTAVEVGQTPSATVIRRFVTEFINGGDESVLKELVHDDYLYRSPDEEIHGRDGLAALFRGFRSAFPDLALTAHELVLDGTKTVLDFSLRGTQRGEFMGIPAAGRSFCIRGIVISRIRDGKIAEEWEVLDVMNLLQQLDPSGEATLAT